MKQFKESVKRTVSALLVLAMTFSSPLSVLAKESGEDNMDESPGIIQDNHIELSDDISEEEKAVRDEETETLTFSEKTFTKFYSEINETDFSTKQLLVGTSDPSIFTWDTKLVSKYEEIYLLQFETELETAYAYSYYLPRADIVMSDTKDFSVSDQEGDDKKEEVAHLGKESDEKDQNSSVEDKILNEGNDAISMLCEVVEDAGTASGAIALIDTGASGPGVVSAWSLLGDKSEDDNGHGTRMAENIHMINPDAEIVSIKALGSDGKGKISDIYAAVEFAISMNVSVINLSLSAVATSENAIVAEAIREAEEKGITVVGAAGNNGKNAKYYVPGKVKEATIVGAAKDGTILPSSNYGETVDYYVEADSTSEAAATLSALLVKGKLTESVMKQYRIITDFNNDDSDKPDENDGVFGPAKGNGHAGSEAGCPGGITNVSKETSGAYDYMDENGAVAMCLMHKMSQPWPGEHVHTKKTVFQSTASMNEKVKTFMQFYFWLYRDFEAGNISFDNMQDSIRIYLCRYDVFSSSLSPVSGVYRTTVPGPDVFAEANSTVAVPSGFETRLAQYRNKPIPSAYVFTMTYHMDADSESNAAGGYQDFLSGAYTSIAKYGYVVKKGQDGRTEKALADVIFQVRNVKDKNQLFYIKTDGNGVAVFAGGGNGTTKVNDSVAGSLNVLNVGNGLGENEAWEYREVKCYANRMYIVDDMTWYPMKNERKGDVDSLGLPNVNTSALLSNAADVKHNGKDILYVYKIDGNKSKDGALVPLKDVVFRCQRSDLATPFYIKTDANGVAILAGGTQTGSAVIYKTKEDALAKKNGQSVTLGGSGNGIGMDENWTFYEMWCDANASYTVNPESSFTYGRISKLTKNGKILTALDYLGTSGVDTSKVSEDVKSLVIKTNGVGVLANFGTETKNAKYIYKMDETGKALSGVTFRLTLKGSTLSRTRTTDANGLILWAGDNDNGLGANEVWEAEEISTPYGYVKDSSIREMGDLFSKTGKYYAEVVTGASTGTGVALSLSTAASATKREKAYQALVAAIGIKTYNGTPAVSSMKAGEDGNKNGQVVNRKAYDPLGLVLRKQDKNSGDVRRVG